MHGIFGDLFDFNGDGKLDNVEQAANFMAFATIMNSKETQEEVTELELSGLEVDELECMDEEERREALEEAGLDPDEYDF